MSESLGVVSYDVRANTKLLDQDLAQARQKMERQGFKVKATLDTSAAEAQLKRIFDKPFKIKADVSDLEAKVKGVMAKVGVGIGGGPSSIGGPTSAPTNVTAYHSPAGGGGIGGGSLLASFLLGRGRGGGGGSAPASRFNVTRGGVGAPGIIPQAPAGVSNTLSTFGEPDRVLGGMDEVQVQQTVQARSKRMPSGAQRRTPEMMRSEAYRALEKLGPPRRPAPQSRFSSLMQMPVGGKFGRAADAGLDSIGLNNSAGRIGGGVLAGVAIVGEIGKAIDNVNEGRLAGQDIQRLRDNNDLRGQVNLTRKDLSRAASTDGRDIIGNVTANIPYIGPTLLSATGAITGQNYAIDKTLRDAKNGYETSSGFQQARFNITSNRNATDAAGTYDKYEGMAIQSRSEVDQINQQKELALDSARSAGVKGGVLDKLGASYDDRAKAVENRSRQDITRARKTDSLSFQYSNEALRSFGVDDLNGERQGVLQKYNTGVNSGDSLTAFRARRNQDLELGNVNKNFQFGTSDMAGQNRVSAIQLQSQQFRTAGSSYLANQADIQSQIQQSREDEARASRGLNASDPIQAARLKEITTAGRLRRDNLGSQSTDLRDSYGQSLRQLNFGVDISRSNLKGDRLSSDLARNEADRSAANFKQPDAVVAKNNEIYNNQEKLIRKDFAQGLEQLTGAIKVARQALSGDSLKAGLAQIDANQQAANYNQPQSVQDKNNELFDIQRKQLRKDVGRQRFLYGEDTSGINAQAGVQRLQNLNQPLTAQAASIEEETTRAVRAVNPDEPGAADRIKAIKNLGKRRLQSVQKTLDNSSGFAQAQGAFINFGALKDPELDDEAKKANAPIEAQIDADRKAAEAQIDAVMKGFGKKSDKEAVAKGIREASEARISTLENGLNSGDDRIEAEKKLKEAQDAIDASSNKDFLDAVAKADAASTPGGSGGKSGIVKLDDTALALLQTIATNTSRQFAVGA